MDNLLVAVLEAHGGSDAWARAKRLTARMSLGGPFWAARGWPEIYADQTVVLDPHNERITFSPFSASGLSSVLSVGPESVRIVDAQGGIVEQRALPRESFPLPFDPANTPWDLLQVAYFTSAAVWNYLTAPFVFTAPGVEAHEMSPWSEGDGVIWRRLAVKFPKTIANHNAEQVFYFDDAFLQQRVDYSPDVTGSPPVAHYCHDHQTFDGLVFPTRRLVYLHDANRVADQSFAPITINVTSVVIDA
jgi:hypothetical protein